MAGYGQFCAMARALEVVGERWTLLVVRELMCGSTRFNQIRRGIPAISRDTLAKRLRQLRAAEIIEQHGEGKATSYSLTPAGHALGPVLVELAVWTTQWDQRGLQSEHLDPDTLFWDLHRRINHAAVPAGRTVIEFVLTDPPDPQQRRWLMIGQSEAEICRTSGGYDVDLVVTASSETLTRWWLGETQWADAVKSGDLQLQGRPELRAAFPTWFLGYALLDPGSHPDADSAVTIR